MLKLYLFLLYLEPLHNNDLDKESRIIMSFNYEKTSVKNFVKLSLLVGPMASSQ